jgi:general secretion pathway protein J
MEHDIANPMHRLAMHHTSDDHGFTLLELLVSLVVLAMLMVTLTQGLRVGLQAWALEVRTGLRGGGLEFTDRALRQLIGRAWPGEPRSQEDVFSLSLVTTLPEGFGARATHEADVTLLVTGGHRLELVWRPHYRRWISPPPPATAITLLDDVAQLDLGFWQPATGSQQARWLSVWSARALPPLVRLRIGFPPGDPRHWPDIVIAPMRELPLP